MTVRFVPVPFIKKVKVTSFEDASTRHTVKMKVGNFSVYRAFFVEKNI